MSLFKQWKKMRDIRETEDDPSSDFRFNSDGTDYAVDNDAIQEEIFRIAMSKYPNETGEFLGGLAQKDQEIAGLLSKLSREPNRTEKPEHPYDDDKDELVPPNADRGFNNEFGGDD